VNYIKIQTKFFKLQKRLKLSANESFVYNFIFNACNAVKWSRPVCLSNSYLTERLNLSENTIIKIRRRLLELGLINWEPGTNQQILSKYSIVDISEWDPNDIPVQRDDGETTETGAGATTSTEGGSTTAVEGGSTTSVEGGGTTSNFAPIYKNNNLKNNNKRFGMVNEKLTDDFDGGELITNVNDQSNPIIKKLIMNFNEKCIAQKKITYTDAGRERMIIECINNFGEKDALRIIQKASQSNFLCGENRFGWIAQFDWIFSPVNSKKILEGFYDNDARAMPFWPNRPSIEDENAELKHYIMTHNSNFMDDDQ